MAYEAVIFDLDGTLWDSFPYYSSVLSGFTGLDSSCYLKELRSGRAIVSLVQENNVSDARFVRELKSSAVTLRLFKGVIEVLEHNFRNEIPQFVLTNLPTRYGQAMLQKSKLDKYFQDRFFYKAGYAKPSSRGLELTLRRNGITPSLSVLSIGDTLSDKAASEKAGLRYLWAGYGYAQKSIIGIEDEVLRNPKDILEI